MKNYLSFIYLKFEFKGFNIPFKIFVSFCFIFSNINFYFKDKKLITKKKEKENKNERKH